MNTCEIGESFDSLPECKKCLIRASCFKIKNKENAKINAKNNKDYKLTKEEQMILSSKPIKSKEAKKC